MHGNESFFHKPGRVQTSLSETIKAQAIHLDNRGNYRGGIGEGRYTIV